MTDLDSGGRSDKELIAAHVAGDAEAFGTLFTRHRDRLWAVALRTMGNPEDAADALQDGMISAFRRAGSFRGDAAVTTWLHRVVVNACLDRMRAAKVRAADALPDDLEEYAGRGRALDHVRRPDPRRRRGGRRAPPTGARRARHPARRAAGRARAGGHGGVRRGRGRGDPRLRGRHHQVPLCPGPGPARAAARRAPRRPRRDSGHTGEPPGRPVPSHPRTPRAGHRTDSVRPAAPSPHAPTPFPGGEPPSTRS